MKLDYDPEIDAAYISLKSPAERIEVAKTVPLDPTAIGGEINLDFDGDGRLVGIEIQSASQFLDSAVLRQADND